MWRPGWQIGLQSLLAAALVLVSAATVMLRARRRGDNALEVPLATHGLVYWLVPLTLGGALSSYRAESLIVPAVTVLGRARWFVVLPLLVCAVAIWFVMATQFVQGALV